MAVIDVKQGVNPVNGTAANDEINLKEKVGNGIVINANAGNDIITVTRGDNHVINAGTGNDIVYATSGKGHKIDLGEGNDRIDLLAGDGHTVTAVSGTNNLNINGGSNYVITGGTGVDKLVIKGNNSNNTINLGDGDDIANMATGSGNTVNGGAGKDYIIASGGETSTFNGDEGDDTIRLYRGEGHTVHAGGGNDVMLVVDANNSKVYGDSGKNQIMFFSGTGNEYYGGVEKDNITLKDRANKVKVTGGTQATVVNIQVGNNHIIDLSAGNNSVTQIMAGEGTDFIGGKGRDTLKVWGTTSGLTADMGAGADLINVKGGTDLSINGGAGNDEFQIIGGDNSNYYSGSGDDIFRLSGGDNNVLNIEVGNNTAILTGGTNTDIITKESGKLNLTISGQATTDQIMIKNEYTHIDASQADNGLASLVIESNADKVEAVLTNKKDKLLIYSGENIIDTGSGDDEVACLGLKNSLIQLGNGNDVFEMQANWGWGTNSKVHGGDGNDRITVGGDTKDCTFNGEAGMDEIIVHSGTYNNFLGGGGADTFTIKGGSKNNYRGAIGRDKILIEGATEFCVVRGDSDNDTILVDARSGSIYSSFITGDGSTDILEIRGNGNMLYGGSGDDNIAVYGDTNLVYGGTEADTCSLYGSKNLCYGGAGDDEFQVSGTKNTCYGGIGDDTFRVTKDKVSTFALVVGGIGNDTYKVQDQDNVWIDLRGNLEGDKDTILVEATKGMKYAYRWYESEGILAIGSVFVQGIQNLNEIRFISNGQTVMSGSGLDLLKYARSNNYSFDEIRSLNTAYLDYGERGSAVTAATLGEALEEVSAGIRATMVEIATSYK